jgi:hypothetical protein
MLVRSPSSYLSLNPLPASLKAIAWGFFVLFHISVWSSSTTYPHLNLLHLPFPFPLVPHHTHTLYLFYSPIFSLLILSQRSRGFSMYLHSEYTLLWSIQPFPLLSLLLYLSSPPLFATAFSTHPYIFYLHRCYVLWYYWCSILFFSFLSFQEFPLLITYFHFAYMDVRQNLQMQRRFCLYMYVIILGIK